MNVANTGRSHFATLHENYRLWRRITPCIQVISWSLGSRRNLLLLFRPSKCTRPSAFLRQKLQCKPYGKSAPDLSVVDHGNTDRWIYSTLVLLSRALQRTSVANWSAFLKHKQALQPLSVLQWGNIQVLSCFPAKEKKIDLLRWGKWINMRLLRGTESGSGDRRGGERGNHEWCGWVTRALIVRHGIGSFIAARHTWIRLTYSWQWS